MLYDIKAHLPELVGMFSEEFRAGDVVKLERIKILICKVIGDLNNFSVKLRDIDMEYNKRRGPLILEIEGLQKRLDEKTKALDGNEKDYWETVFGEVIRVNNSIVGTGSETDE